MVKTWRIKATDAKKTILRKEQIQLEKQYHRDSGTELKPDITLLPSPTGTHSKLFQYCNTQVQRMPLIPALRRHTQANF